MYVANKEVSHSWGACNQFKTIMVILLSYIYICVIVFLRSSSVVNTTVAGSPTV